jgi:hypothetical protein
MNKHFLPFNNVGYNFGRIAQQHAKLLLTLLVYGLSFGRGELAEAQPNCSSFSGPVITNFADWDWTIATTDPNYCATWAIQTSTSGTKFVVGAPWYSPINGALNRIYLDQDYTKIKGWQLLRMNMGGRSPIATPYFVLYNKFRGIIRTFFFIDNVGVYPNGLTITMSHNSSNGSYSSGVLALSQPLAQSQDYYLQNRNNNHEIISYVTRFTSQRGWVFADFQAGFDSNVGNSQYSGSSLEFDVLAITINNVRLAGALNFKTEQQVQEGGYGIGGAATGVGTSGLNNFLANGQKVLTAVGSDDLNKLADNYKLKADKTVATVHIPVTQAQHGAISTAVSHSGSTLKTVVGLAGALGPWVGLIGSVVGALWPDDNPSAPAAAPFYPTVSNGTLSLKGTISTTAPKTSFTMQVPGSQHFFPHNPGAPTNQTDGGNQPYYDCPLGIFTIKNTPIVGAMVFTPSEGYASVSPYRLTYASYLVTNDLIPIYNAAAGLKLESVQASIVAESPTRYFNATVNGPNGQPVPNFVQKEVYSGEVEVVAANDSLVTYGTPFINIENFKNEAITAFYDSKVYVRIKAVLMPKDAPLGTPPIYFVQDYAIQTANVTATNPLYYPQPDDNGDYYSIDPPYTNHLSAASFPGASYAPYTVASSNTTSLNPSLEVTAGRYTAPIVLSAGLTISAGNPPRTSSGGNVTLDHPTTSTPSVFVSGQSIELGAGFSVTPGTNFVAVTPIHAWKQGGQVLTQVFDGPCSYNSNTAYNPVAYRSSNNSGKINRSATVKDNLTASPNPTDGIVTVATSVAGESNAVVVVTDYMGREIQRINSIPAGLSSQRINLAGKASGIYLIRLITKDKTVTQKVVLQ